MDGVAGGAAFSLALLGSAVDDALAGLLESADEIGARVATLELLALANFLGGGLLVGAAASLEDEVAAELRFVASSSAMAIFVFAVELVSAASAVVVGGSAWLTFAGATRGGVFAVV